MIDLDPNLTAEAKSVAKENLWNALVDTASDAAAVWGIEISFSPAPDYDNSVGDDGTNDDGGLPPPLDNIPFPGDDSGGGDSGGGDYTTGGYADLPLNEQDAVDEAIYRGLLTEAEVANMSTAELRDWLTDNFGW